MITPDAAGMTAAAIVAAGLAFAVSKWVATVAAFVAAARAERGIAGL